MLKGEGNRLVGGFVFVFIVVAMETARKNGRTNGHCQER